MGIRAVTTEGAPLTGNWQPAIIRNAALIIPIFGLVELIILLTRQEKPPPLLRLGDEWAHTKVVNAGDPAAEEEGKSEGGEESPPEEAPPAG